MLSSAPSSIEAGAQAVFLVVGLGWMEGPAKFLSPTHFVKEEGDTPAPLGRGSAIVLCALESSGLCVPVPSQEMDSDGHSRGECMCTSSPVLPWTQAPGLCDEWFPARGRREVLSAQGTTQPLGAMDPREAWCLRSCKAPGLG